MMIEPLDLAIKRRPPRLNHKKSKFGCLRCKARRVKCDEKHPICGGCERHEVPCVYAEAQDVLPNSGLCRPPQNVSLAGIGHDDYNAEIPESKDRRLEELRLMHTWTALTSATLPDADAPEVRETWAKDVPPVALDHPALLCAILAFSAFHLSVLEPQSGLSHIIIARKYLHLAMRHHEAAVALLSRENADKVALTCLLISVLIFRDLNSPSLRKENHVLPGQYVSSPSTVTQRLVISHATGLRFREAWVWVKDDPKALSARIVKTSPMYNETRQHCLHLDDGRRTWPREFGDAYKHLLDPNANTGPVETTMTDAGPMMEELWDPSIRSCYEDVLNHIGAIHAAVLAKDEANLALCRRLIAFPCLLPKRFFDLLRENRPRALVILAQFFAAAKAVEDVWWVGDAGKTEVHAIWESLDERWKRQMGEALRMVHTNRE